MINGEHVPGVWVRRIRQENKLMLFSVYRISDDDDQNTSISKKFDQNRINAKVIEYFNWTKVWIFHSILDRIN